MYVFTYNEYRPYHSKMTTGLYSSSSVYSSITNDLSQMDNLCIKCGLPIVGISVDRHNKERCNHRLIWCINREFGCQMEVPLNELHKHLRYECKHEMKKNEKVIYHYMYHMICINIMAMFISGRH